MSYPAITMALTIMRRLSCSGFASYIVGGTVRDLLLCRVPGDVDIATSALLEDICSVWPEARIVGKPGKRSAILPTSEGTLDLVSYSGESLSEELRRRDFTINAMALSETGEIEDPWGGKHDLAERLIRGTANPGDRLAEDPVRAVRAARFAAMEPAFSIDKETASRCRESAPKVERAAPERIGREVLKSLKERPSRFLEELEKLGLLKATLPFLKISDTVCGNASSTHWDERFLSTIKRCKIMEETTPDITLRAAALFYEIGGIKQGANTNGHNSAIDEAFSGAKRAGEIMTGWAWPRSVAKEVVRLVRWRGLLSEGAEPKELRRLMVLNGTRWMDCLFLLSKADIMALSTDFSPWLENRRIVLESTFRLTGTKPPLDGEDVMKILDIKEGPKVGEALSALSEEMAEKGTLDAESAAEWLRKRFSRNGTTQEKDAQYMENGEIL